MTRSVMEMIGAARARVGIVGAGRCSRRAGRRNRSTGGRPSVRGVGARAHRRFGGDARGLLEFIADPTSPRHKVEMDPGKRVIVVCASGARAALAAATLQDMGYLDVAVLDGGINAWREVGLPITGHEYEGI